MVRSASRISSKALPSTTDQLADKNVYCRAGESSDAHSGSTVVLTGTTASILFLQLVVRTAIPSKVDREIPRRNDRIRWIVIGSGGHY